LRSQGQINGNGAVDAFFAGASADGARIFFETDEQLVSADTDTSTDIYERAAGQTTLLSPSSGAFTAEFRDASADGSAVFFSTADNVLASDTDASRDVYGAFDTP
jgi:hypothetical protein